MRRKGLTLIEVLIIIVMIGILLTLVITKFANRKVKEARMALQSEVRNVKVAESRYFATYNRYGTLAQLDSAQLFRAAPEHALTITLAPDGYTAAATDNASSAVCTLVATGGEAGAATAQATCP